MAAEPVLPGIVNGIVLAMSAVLLGVVLRLASLLTPEAMRRGRPPRRPGESLGSYLRRSSLQGAKSSREAVRTGPASYRLMLLAFYGLLAMLVTVLWLSPVYMNWPVFLGVFFAAFLLADWIYKRARAGRQ